MPTKSIFYHRTNHKKFPVNNRWFWLIIIISVSWVLSLWANFYLPQLARIIGFQSSIAVPEVLTEINSQRTEVNLLPLKLNDQLSEAAWEKAQDMMNRQYWSHNSPDGFEPWIFLDRVGYNYKFAGENLARNFSDTNQMVQAWMSSPTHKENILNPEYTEIGIAVLSGSYQDNPTTLVVNFFGKPLNSPNIGQESGTNSENSLTDSQANESQVAGARVQTAEQIILPTAAPATIITSANLYQLGLITITTIVITSSLKLFSQPKNRKSK